MHSFTRKSLFASAKEKWPPRYRISHRAPRSGAVITDPSISETYRRIEGEIGSDDEWSQLAAWAFCQALSNIVEDGFRSGKSIVEKMMSYLNILIKK